MALKVKQNILKYKEALSKKYGKPEVSFEGAGLDFYKKSDEFYQSLKYYGCGYYVSVFGDHLSIRLEGIGRGKGNLNIFYESELLDKYKLYQANENKIKKWIIVGKKMLKHIIYIFLLLLFLSGCNKHLSEEDKAKVSVLNTELTQVNNDIKATTENDE